MGPAELADVRVLPVCLATLMRRLHPARDHPLVLRCPLRENHAHHRRPYRFPLLASSPLKSLRNVWLGEVNGILIITSRLYE